MSQQRLVTVLLVVVGLEHVFGFPFSCDAFVLIQSHQSQATRPSPPASPLSAKSLEDDKHSLGHTISSSFRNCHNYHESRRELLKFAMTTASVAIGFPMFPAVAEEQDAVVLRLNSDQQSAGLQLRDIMAKNGKTAVVIERVVLRNEINQELQPGMILEGPYPNAKAVVARIRGGPYPLELTFVTNPNYQYVPPTQSQEPQSPPENAYIKRVLSKPSECTIRAQRDDVVELNYEAYYLKPSAPLVDFNLENDAILYDSSAQRGTGLPYQMVMGSGDMIPGVDQGIVNMCPGEIRQLEIPPPLGYGPKARRLYGIPDGAKLVWKVEVVAVNSMRQYE